MKDVLLILQVVFSVGLIGLISLQVKGGGLSRSFTAASFSRRGIEKLVFKATFAFAFLFILISSIQLVI